MKETLRNYLNTNIALAGKEIDEIVDLFYIKSVSSHTVLLSEGEISTELFFVNKGCLRTYYVNKFGGEMTRYIGFENSMVTSISSFISQRPSLEFVEAVEDAELLAIGYSDFYQVLKTVPAWKRFYLSLLKYMYVYQDKRIEYLKTLSEKERYEKFLTEHHLYAHRLSDKILASYLDVREETLSGFKVG